MSKIFIKKLRKRKAYYLREGVQERKNTLFYIIFVAYDENLLLVKLKNHCYPINIIMITIMI